MDMMKIKTNGEDINFIQKIKLETDVQIVYQPEAKCFHLQDDNTGSLSKEFGDIILLDIKSKNLRFIKL